MLNIIWPLFIIISFIYAFFSGNIENVSNGIFTSLTEVVNLCLTFLETMCLWNGIMEIAKRTTLIRKLTIFFRPLINFLFPELKENEQAKEEISMNMIANILGLGNAATPLGIKAMKTLQKYLDKLGITLDQITGERGYIYRTVINVYYILDFCNNYKYEDKITRKPLF